MNFCFLFTNPAKEINRVFFYPSREVRVFDYLFDFSKTMMFVGLVMIMVVLMSIVRMMFLLMCNNLWAKALFFH